MHSSFKISPSSLEDCQSLPPRQTANRLSTGVQATRQTAGSARWNALPPNWRQIHPSFKISPSSLEDCQSLPPRQTCESSEDGRASNATDSELGTLESTPSKLAPDPPDFQDQSIMFRRLSESTTTADFESSGDGRASNAIDGALGMLESTASELTPDPPAASPTTADAPALASLEREVPSRLPRGPPLASERCGST